MTWVQQAGGSSLDYGYSISALADGSSLITGYFYGTTSFGSTTLTSAGYADVFIAKLNADGSYAWAQQAGGSGSDTAYSISALADGSSLITGTFQDTASFGSTTLTAAGYYDTASFGSTTLTSAGSWDVFIAKLNADGSYAWAQQAEGSERDYPQSISALADGSSLIIGNFNGTASFGSTTLTSAGTIDVFIAKLNADGSYAWAQQAGGSGYDNGHGISALADGSSLITGTFTGTASFGSTTLTSAGSNDVFIAKLNADGSYAWVQQAGGSERDYGYSISALADGSSLITGTFEGTASFGSTALTSAGYSDVFIANLNADGSWASTNTSSATNSNDTLTGTDSNDSLTGTDSGEIIIGLYGDDYIDARAGDDSLLGGFGNDTIYGGSGNDEITGGTGIDNLYGESGHDRFFISTGDGYDIIEDFIPGEDNIYSYSTIELRTRIYKNEHLLIYSGKDLMAGIRGGADFNLTWDANILS